jgi:hypothetical protein
LGRYPKIITLSLINFAQQHEAQHEQWECGADTSTAHSHVLTAKEIEEIWSDIRTMVTLSWLTSVPKELRFANNGKTKVDQWCTLGTTYLPISLIHLWVKVNDSDARSVRCRKILDVTITLLSTIIIASS